MNNDPVQAFKTLVSLLPEKFTWVKLQNFKSILRAFLTEELYYIAGTHSAFYYTANDGTRLIFEAVDRLSITDEFVIAEFLYKGDTIVENTHKDMNYEIP